MLTFLATRLRNSPASDPASAEPCLQSAPLNSTPRSAVSIQGSSARQPRPTMAHSVASPAWTNLSAFRKQRSIPIHPPR